MKWINFSDEFPAKDKYFIAQYEGQEIIGLYLEDGTYAFWALPGIHVNAKKLTIWRYPVHEDKMYPKK